MAQGLGILEFLSKIPPNPQKLSKERMRSKKIGILLLEILEFPALLRGSKATEAISRNSKFCLGILEFLEQRSSGQARG